MSKPIRDIIAALPRANLDANTVAHLEHIEEQELAPSQPTEFDLDAMGRACAIRSYGDQAGPAEIAEYQAFMKRLAASEELRDRNIGTTSGSFFDGWMASCEAHRVPTEEQIARVLAGVYARGESASMAGYFQRAARAILGLFRGTQ